MTTPTSPSARPSPSARRYASTPIQIVALVSGIVFLLVGITGFIPGLTQNYEALMAAGHQSEAMLLGLFQVSVLHNTVHLLFGVAGVAVAISALASRQYLIWGGVAYAALWIYGLFTADTASPMNFLPLNAGDNWLHVGLALAMILLGVFVPRASTPPAEAVSM